MNDLKEIADILNKHANAMRATEEDAFNAGCDAGANGVNSENCHFKYFGSPALTAAWERGKKAAQLRMTT